MNPTVLGQTQCLFRKEKHRCVCYIYKYNLICLRKAIFDLMIISCLVSSYVSFHHIFWFHLTFGFIVGPEVAAKIVKVVTLEGDLIVVQGQEAVATAAAVAADLSGDLHPPPVIELCWLFHGLLLGADSLFVVHVGQQAVLASTDCAITQELGLMLLQCMSYVSTECKNLGPC